MRIRKIDLDTFRNYSRLALASPAQRLVLVGPNGQGKTNLFEAIYLGLTGDSLRGGRDREMVQWGQSGYRVQLDVEREDGELEAVVASQLQGGRTQRQVKVNGTPVPARELRGFFSVVVFTPETLSMVKGGPQERRRFLDELLSQASSYYRHHLQRYQRLLSQRNAVLQRMAAPGAGQRRAQLQRLLETFTEPFLETAARLWERRLWALQQLAEPLQRSYQEIAGEPGRLTVHYQSEARPGNGDGAPGQKQGQGCTGEPEDWPALRERLWERLQEVAPGEWRRGVTLIGPQRDDLTLEVAGVDLRAFGSQGQQRSAVLALKLAEADFLRQQTGRWPVLLLDDVLSELDPGRRRRFLATIPGDLQVWITTAEPGLVGEMHPALGPGPDDTLVLAVSAGHIEGARSQTT